ncbi:MAG: encapsulin [Sporolactobacillus sp.]
MPAPYRANLRALDLEQLDNVLYEPKYEELTARQCFDIKSDVPAGAETYAYNVMTRTGIAKIMANGADDLPLVDVDLKREHIDIYTIAVGYSYSVQELRAAQMANTPLDTARAAVARRAIAEKENKIAWLGDSKYNIKGTVNATGIQTQAVAQNAGATSTKWVDKTSEEIIEDIRKLRKLITVLPGHANSGSLCLCVPADQFEELNRRYSDYDARSILQVLSGYEWFSMIHRVPDLKGVGVSGTDSMLIMDCSPEVMQLLISMDLTRLDPEWKYPRWKVPCEERLAGVIVRYPMGVARGDGI